MSRPQRTIRREVETEGVGLFTGVRAKVRLVPAPTASGVTFVRTDLPGRPRIPARPDYSTDQPRRTCLLRDGAGVETVEHCLSAVHGCGIDNLDIEISGPELPNLDGSSRPFVDLIRQAEPAEQDAPRRVITLREPVAVNDRGATLVALPADEGLDISYTLDYDHPLLRSQHFHLQLSEAAFAAEIAPARTFCLQAEAEELLRQGLGKGGTYENTLIVGPDGVKENQLRFRDEFVRHKILDLIGDLTLLQGELRASLVAVKSGHGLNLRLVRRILESVRESAAPSRPKQETLLDVREMLKILPHRYPFLLIDKVIEMESYRRAVGIKNVTFNEPYFQGHFPGRPIMPGVLQIEAMAQLAGALLMRKAENHNKLAVLLAMDNVKLRKTVVPGDQLRIEVEVIRVKSRTGVVHTRCTVDGQLVSEAEMKFMLVDPE